MVFMDSELAFICGIHWSGSRLIRNSKLVGVRFWKDVLEKEVEGTCEKEVQTSCREIRTKILAMKSTVTLTVLSVSE